MDAARTLLRHTLATVAYRGGKALRGAPPSFAEFKAGPTTRTPLEILAHIGDLFDWALTMTNGKPVWNTATPQTWDAEVARFHKILETLDARLTDEAPLATTPEKLFQGPIADALTHIGQIAMLRRLAEAPIKGESYFRAKITTGQVSTNQPAPVLEFD